MTSNTPDTSNRLKVFIEQRLQELQWDFSRLAREYGKIKEQEPNIANIDPNRYRSTVVRIVQDPERSQMGNVLVCLTALEIGLLAVIRKVELN